MRHVDAVTTQRQCEEQNLKVAEAFMAAGYPPHCQALVDQYVHANAPKFRKVPTLPDGQPFNLAEWQATMRRLDRAKLKTQPRTAAEIVADTAARYNISTHEMYSRRRFKRITNARQAAFWLLTKELGWSLPRVGKYFGGMDHTSVLHGIRAHAKRHNLTA